MSKEVCISPHMKFNPLIIIRHPNPFHIPKSQLPSGLIYVCIYDANNKLLKLKTVYFQPFEIIKPAIYITKNQYHNCKSRS